MVHTDGGSYHYIIGFDNDKISWGWTSHTLPSEAEAIENTYAVLSQMVYNEVLSLRPYYYVKP